MAATLWARYRRRLDVAPEENPDGSADLPAERDEAAYLEAEVVRLGSAPPEGLTDIRQTVAGVLELIATVIDKNCVQIHSHLSDVLRPAAMNRAALRQVLLNLLNCVAAMLPAGTVEVSAVDSVEGIVLHLRIARRPDAFEIARSFSLASAIGDDPRTTLSRRLVEMQGGKLALGAAERDELAIEVLVPAANLTTVLVIDDDPDVAQLFRRYLRGAPYRLLQASTVRRAFELAREAQPEVIILDVMMPSRDGWEVLQELRARSETRSIPIVVCSVLQERAMATALGATMFLRKPVTRQTLLAALVGCQAEPGAHPDSLADSS